MGTFTGVWSSLGGEGGLGSGVEEVGGRVVGGVSMGVAWLGDSIV